LGAVCFGLVANELRENQEQEISSRENLRELLWEKIQSEFGDAKRYGTAPYLSNTLLINFPGCLGADLVAALDLEEVAASTGSACASGKQGVSETVLAIEPNREAAKNVVRFSLDWNTSEQEILQAAKILSSCVRRIRNAQLKAV
jgi:cysteine desulfurase